MKRPPKNPTSIATPNPPEPPPDKDPTCASEVQVVLSDVQVFGLNIGDPATAQFSRGSVRIMSVGRVLGLIDHESNPSFVNCVEKGMGYAGVISNVQGQVVEIHLSLQ